MTFCLAKTLEFLCRGRDDAVTELRDGLFRGRNDISMVLHHRSTQSWLVKKRSGVLLGSSKQQDEHYVALVWVWKADYVRISGDILLLI